MNLSLVKRATYEKSIDAAYIYLVDYGDKTLETVLKELGLFTDKTIIVDFSKTKPPFATGIEVLGATRVLSKEFLDSCDQL